MVEKKSEQLLAQCLERIEEITARQNLLNLKAEVETIHNATGDLLELIEETDLKNEKTPYRGSPNEFR
ncbi:hypothetical protein O9H85_28605 [Paenibacillus filicis]|uniref:Uncharacterized protein n=1 Tax=Paenibacillus gyeongsangnamensis TaxID=3388067 RepID=A0ABT4QHF7_9BACL|nr:hypothetical protein [Paenibacillus filicis]MCZ8516284.1 hypothetical protein [Paenibacillus filicis]